MSFSEQLEMISLEDLVPPNHQYRKFSELFDFKIIAPILRKAEMDSPHKGYGIMRLSLQFMED